MSSPSSPDWLLPPVGNSRCRKIRCKKPKQIAVKAGDAVAADRFVLLRESVPVPLHQPLSPGDVQDVVPETVASGREVPGFFSVEDELQPPAFAEAAVQILYSGSPQGSLQTHVLKW